MTETSRIRVKKNYLVLILILISSIFFFCVGEKSYVIFDDSQGYMAPNLNEGIMPGYQFFLNALKLVNFNQYLFFAMVIQCLLSVFCVTTFTMYIGKKFQIAYFEYFIVWAMSLLPFSVELPRYLTSHIIYTEAITYPLYYLFSICFYEAITSKSEAKLKKSYCGMIIMSFFLAFIRPQLLLLFLISGSVGFWGFIKQNRNKAISLLVGVIIFLLTILFGVLGIYSARNLYIRTVGHFFLEKYYLIEEVSIEENEVPQTCFNEPNESTELAEGNSEPVELSRIENTEQNIGEEEPVFSQDQYERQASGQLTNALLCRTFFCAEESDVDKYDSPLMRSVFTKLYNICNEEQLLFCHIPKGLWAWEEMTRTDIYKVYNDMIYQYFDSDEFPKEDGLEYYYHADKVARKLILTEMSAHPVRYLYYSIRIMIPGFIACVFFNIKKIYVFCHVFTVIVFTGAGVLAFIMKRRGYDEAKVVLGNIFSCVAFVVPVTLIFVGMQRYFLYQMGVFYTGLYCLLRAALLNYIQNKRN